MQVLHSGWTLKYHSRRERWMLADPTGRRIGFASREAAVRFAERNGIGFEEAVKSDNDRAVSDKTARRRAKQAARAEEGGENE